MGYQVVDIRLEDGRLIERAVVFNCEEIQLAEDLANSRIKEIRLHAD
jgi:hypothetical protein